jgi:hypothetical protein
MLNVSLLVLGDVAALGYVTLYVNPNVVFVK